ncbi:mannose-1-phosphate guanylyltransferase/phosphomannomutase [Alkaliphilus hydrothermalis]|uniref:Mannose-1-phosphate guanylyltransferase/phosphomannomutase n=1 Tax=Alkaliphilus hydrothermalis TaxID=1482730 RepID=A0ABS2NKL9_9FIRM|nr:mannose-1-phosphate guanylyltransferase/phosphomannomutase [Alkaliphilus hydrothermalis]
MIIIKGLIMAGGKGTRLKPLTCSLPKPMVPIMNKPVMEYSIELLKKHGITEIAVTLAYMPTEITDYFGNGEKWGVNLHYFIEDEPLGTGGSVKNAESFIDDTLIIISGDALTDLDIQTAIDYHREKESKATLVLRNEEVPIEYGVVITDDRGKIRRFLEKPSWGEVFSNTINTGIYILEPEVLDYYNRGDKFDFSKDLFPKLLKDQVPMYGYVMEGYWCDIGDLNSYKQTHFDILDDKVEIKLDAKYLAKGSWIGEGTHMGEGVKIVPPIYIGRNCRIKDNVVLDQYTVIGDDCIIGKDSSMKRSILWEGTSLGEQVEARGAVICHRAIIKNKVELLENAVIGDFTHLAEGVVVKPDIKIWPSKKITENTIVNQNLIWGTKASKILFGYRNISGEINLDINPEFASRVGASYSTSIQGDTTLVVSSDDSNGANLVQNALISGIQSTGSQAIQLQGAVMPMARYAVQYFRADGGIHVATDRKNPNKITIEFLDEKGGNISRSKERDVENLFSRDDFKRCNGEQVKKVIYVNEFKSFFIKDGLKEFKNTSNIKKNNFKIILSSYAKNGVEVTGELLEEMGCHVEYHHPKGKEKMMDFHIASLAKEVMEEGAFLGVFLSETGEELMLVDEKGRIIGQENYSALAVLLQLKSGVKDPIILPHTAPRVTEEMARGYEVEVIRTKSDPSNILKEMLQEKEFGGKVALQYLLSYNAVWAIGWIVDFLGNLNTTLGELVDELPQMYFLKREISCDWRDKGRVMREIIEEYSQGNVELFEGVKINDDRGWTLILPDSERPLFNIYAEGYTEEFAEELSSSFTEKLKTLIGK